MRNMFRLFALVAGLWLAGCSTYNQRWEAARTDRDRFTGAYSGRWESIRMPGTGGSLWCIVNADTPGTYRADFKATWHGVFRSEHSAVLKRQGNAFHADATLETWIGAGKYTCDGKFRTGGISANYDAVYDEGRFILTRAQKP